MMEFHRKGGALTRIAFALILALALSTTTALGVKTAWAEPAIRVCDVYGNDITYGASVDINVLQQGIYVYILELDTLGEDRRVTMWCACYEEDLSVLPENQSQWGASGSICFGGQTVYGGSPLVLNTYALSIGGTFYLSSYLAIETTGTGSANQEVYVLPTIAIGVTGGAGGQGGENGDTGLDEIDENPSGGPAGPGTETDPGDGALSGSKSDGSPEDSKNPDGPGSVAPPAGGADPDDGVSKADKNPDTASDARSAPTGFDSLIGSLVSSGNQDLMQGDGLDGAASQSGTASQSAAYDKAQDAAGTAAALTDIGGTPLSNAAVNRQADSVIAAGGKVYKVAGMQAGSSGAADASANIMEITLAGLPSAFAALLSLLAASFPTGMASRMLRHRCGMASGMLGRRRGTAVKEGKWLTAPHTV